MDDLTPLLAGQVNERPKGSWQSSVTKESFWGAGLGKEQRRRFQDALSISRATICEEWGSKFRRGSYDLKG